MSRDQQSRKDSNLILVGFQPPRANPRVNDKDFPSWPARYSNHQLQNSFVQFVVNSGLFFSHFGGQQRLNLLWQQLCIQFKSICILKLSLPVNAFSDFRSSFIFHLLCDSSQRDDTGEIPQHSREAQEVAAACGQGALGTGTVLPSLCSSDDAHLTASCPEAGGCTSRTDPLPCSWHSALLRTFGGKRRICSIQGSVVQLFIQLLDCDRLSLGCW